MDTRLVEAPSLEGTVKIYPSDIKLPMKSLSPKQRLPMTVLLGTNDPLVGMSSMGLSPMQLHC